MGRFADLDDVTSRFEGIIPSDREDWVETRITDVEAVLTGLVPSLEESDNVIGVSRLARVKALVCEKVLDLYRNPARVNQQSNTAGQYSESITFLSGLAGSKAGISFSAEELRGVRLRNRRANLGTTKLAPWRPERDPVLYRDADC
jgi:hypothetical protein